MGMLEGQPGQQPAGWSVGEREGQDSRVTTKAAEGPSSGAERALSLKARIGGPTVET